MKKIGLILFLGVLILTGFGCKRDESWITPNDQGSEGVEDSSTTITTMQPTSGVFPGVLSEEERLNKQIRISTDKGDIVFELFGDTAPKAVSNMIALANQGYFNGLTFHRREEGFVIQGGDPNGNGTGGPGYTFEDELDDNYLYERGIVAMANRGPDTNGSQFFIMLTDYPLPKSYTIFGRVIEGIDIVDQIQVGDVMNTVGVESK